MKLSIPIQTKYIHVPFYKGYNIQFPYKELPIGFTDMQALIDVHKEKKEPPIIALEGDPQECMPQYAEEYARQIMQLTSKEYAVFKERFHMYLSELGEKDVTFEIQLWLKKNIGEEVELKNLCIEEGNKLTDVYQVIKENLISRHYQQKQRIPVFLNLNGKTNVLIKEKNIIDNSVVSYTIKSKSLNFSEINQIIDSINGELILISETNNSELSLLQKLLKKYPDCLSFQKINIYKMPSHLSINLEKDIVAFVVGKDNANFIIAKEQIIKWLRFNIKLTRDFVNLPLQIKLLKSLRNYPHKAQFASERQLKNDGQASVYFKEILDMDMAENEIRYVGGVTEAWYLTLKILLKDFYKRNKYGLKQPAILLYNQNYGYSVYTSSYLGINIIPIYPTSNFTVENLQDLKNKYEILCLKMENPHNPTGFVWEKKEIKNISKNILKLQKIFPHLYIFDDLIYAGMEYGTKKTFPFAKIKTLKNMVITSVSPSKLFGTVATRAGFIHSYDKSFNQKLDREIKLTGRPLNIYSKAIIKYFCRKEFSQERKEYQQNINKTYQKNIQYVVDILHKSKEVSHIDFEYPRPESGFFMMLKITHPQLKHIPYQNISKNLGKYYIEENDLLTLPNSTFTIDETRNKYYSLRISIAYKKEFLDKIMQQVTEGAKYLKDKIPQICEKSCQEMRNNLPYAAQRHYPLNLCSIVAQDYSKTLINIITTEDISNLDLVRPYVKDWNIKDNQGKPLIFLAIETQNIPIVKLVLSQKVDLSVKYKNYNIYQYALLTKNKKIIKLIKESLNV